MVAGRMGFQATPVVGDDFLGGWRVRFVEPKLCPRRILCFTMGLRLRSRGTTRPAFGTASVRSDKKRRSSTCSIWRRDIPPARPARNGSDARATIAVIIPTFERPEMLQNLLVSLRCGNRIPDEVIVVDNDPKESANPAAIDGLSVHVIHAGLGISLSGARNVGWRSADSDICIFIDDDNVVEPDAVSQLGIACERREVGLAGPVVFAGDSGTVWCGGIYRSVWTGQTRCILGGESTMPAASTWYTDDMPDAFAIPREVLEEIGGFDEAQFPIHYDEADVNARIRKLGLETIVVRDAHVRHYGWVGLSPGSAMVRATANGGLERARQMALSRVRFHMIHSSGPPKWSAVGIFLPLWAVLTSIGCVGADASWRTRMAAVRAVSAGMISGYREALRVQSKQGNGQDMVEVKEKDWAESDGLIGALVPPARMVIANALKSLAFHSGLHRLIFYRYDYMFRPRELSLLVSCITETCGLTGPILEIGCAAGHTTVYLNKHLDDLEDSREYVCLDTFAGFTNDDIAVEVGRGHDRSRYSYLFRAYRKEWFDQTMANNHVDRVSSIQADVNAFDFSPYENVSLCLIDVDLMRPVERSLQEVFARMAPGGIILVDDCRPNLKYDGALAAYLEFAEEHDLPIDIREEKVGVIQVPNT